MFTRSRNIQGSVAMPFTQAASCAGTCSAVMNQASAAVAPSTTITTALVWNAFRMRRGTSAQEMSR